MSRLRVDPDGDILGYWGRAGLGGACSSSEPLEPEKQNVVQWNICLFL